MWWHTRSQAARVLQKTQYVRMFHITSARKLVHLSGSLQQLRYCGMLATQTHAHSQESGMTRVRLRCDCLAPITRPKPCGSPRRSLECSVYPYPPYDATTLPKKRKNFANRIGRVYFSPPLGSTLEIRYPDKSRHNASYMRVRSDNGINSLRCTQ